MTDLPLLVLGLLRRIRDDSPEPTNLTVERLSRELAWLTQGRDPVDLMLGAVEEVA